MATRQQATLYVPLPHAAEIERLRATYNPAQQALIRAHVTLCREDEVEDWGEVAARLRAMGPVAVSLSFGAPVRDGNLAFLPAIGPTSSFDELRVALLARPGVIVRKHAPHITLIHPRNGFCTDMIFAELAARCRSFAVTFREVSLIRQVDGGRWQEWLGA